MRREKEDDFEFQDTPATMQSSDVLDELISGLPNSEGYYMKLYRETPLGKWELKEKIVDYDSWTDLEWEIKNLVIQRTQMNPLKWGSGSYKLMVFKEGRNGFVKRPLTLSIDAGENTSINTASDVKNKLSEVGEFVKQINDIKLTTQPSASSAPPIDAKMIAETFKSGIDMAKSMMPPTSTSMQTPMDAKTIAETFKSGIDMAKSMMPPTSALTQAPTQMDTMNMMLAMFKVMKETEKPERPKEDPFEMLLKLKQLGMINMPNDNPPIKDDPINQVSKISELMQVMAPLMGNSPIEQPSAWMKLVEIVAPAIPQIIANVTQAVQSVTDLSKAKLSASLGAPLPQSVPSQIGIAGAPLPLNTQMPQNLQTPQNEVKSMNPIVKQIYQAIKAKDATFYPQMKSLIESWVNPYVITELREGRAQLDDFLSQAGIMLGEKWFTTDETKTYFEGFIAWCKEEHIKNIVVVKCDKCGDYFDVNKADFKHGEKCDCGGLLEAISNNGVTADSGVAV